MPAGRRRREPVAIVVGVQHRSGGRVTRYVDDGLGRLMQTVFPGHHRDTDGEPPHDSPERVPEEPLTGTDVTPFDKLPSSPHWRSAVAAPA